MLKSLLIAYPTPFVWAQLDGRIKDKILLPAQTNAHWVTKSVWSRLRAEWRIYRQCAPDDTVLCFHGLPPLFPLRGHVVVFAQNRLLFETSSLRAHLLLPRLRLMAERWLTRAMSRNCDRYIVQTNSMASVVRCCLGIDTEVSVMPFIGTKAYFAVEATVSSSKKYDFVYVASGDAHKNHGNLLMAWRLLADASLKLTLALTVNPQSFPLLSGEISRYTKEYDLDIVNLGQVPAVDIPALYQSSSALIFPSKIESLGLPLIEASRLGLPILASELDYVRDVVQPVETFDPNSPVSIARAVRRFLNNPEPVAHVRTAEEFLAEVLR